MKTSTSIPSYRDNSLPLFARIKIAWHILFKIEAKNSEDKRKAEERSKILKAQRETKVGGMPHKVWY